jgi:anthranilate synthase component I
MTTVIGRADLDRLVTTHRLVPITRTLFADAETPVGVYRKLAAGRPNPARRSRGGRSSE